MPCTSIVGIPTGDCPQNSGGIYEFSAIDQESITDVTVDEATHTITAMTVDVADAFENFKFKRNVGSVVTSPGIDLIAGSTVYNTTATLAFHRREASKSRSLQILAEGQRYLAIVFKDANGEWWYIDHAQLNGGDETTGTTKAEGSKYDVTFLAEMDNRMYKVDDTVIATIIS
jgi:hypothetical protein